MKAVLRKLAFAGAVLLYVAAYILLVAVIIMFCLSGLHILNREIFGLENTGLLSVIVAFVIFAVSVYGFSRTFRQKYVYLKRLFLDVRE